MAAMAMTVAPPTAFDRQFKMLRLVKGDNGELGIYIKKKPSPDSGSLGYVIADIEPGALADRLLFIHIFQILIELKELFNL